MPTGPTPRQLARSETTARIKTLALDQLARAGAGELSLRAIARELNLVSSAIYRYYPSRDELITDLIVDAYADLARTLDSAGAGEVNARAAWVATAHALRGWARAAPHRFALIYGSAIPGYAAPERTIEPAGRVAAGLLRPAVAGAPGPPPRPLATGLAAQLDVVSAMLELETPGDAREVALRAAGAFARLIGALTLELGGHFVGGFDPADALYAELVEREADALGLASAS